MDIPFPLEAIVSVLAFPDTIGERDACARPTRAFERFPSSSAYLTFSPDLRRLNHALRIELVIVYASVSEALERFGNVKSSVKSTSSVPK